MKLIKVEIDGFRNIDKASISLSEITTLVSVNGYGKSNLMTAIDFAASFISADSTTKQNMMSDKLYLPRNKETAGRDFTADFLFLTEDMGTTYYADYGFSFEWRRNDKSGGGRITGEWLTLQEGSKARGPTQLILRQPQPFFSEQKEEKCDRAIDVGYDELIINRLKVSDKLYYLWLVKELNSFGDHGVYLERHFDTRRLFLPSGTTLKSGKYSFDLNRLNLIPEMVYQLKKEYPGKYKILTDAFRQLFPNIEGIDVRETDWQLHHTNMPLDPSSKIEYAKYSMFVNDVNLNEPTNVSFMSDGARRVLLMLTVAVAADIKGFSLIEIEEPENSIHPALLQSYLNVLSQFAGNCRILISSHSPYIVQYVNTADIYIGRPNRSGLAQFSRIKNSKVKELLEDCKQGNESVGDYIFDLLSGSDDYTAILLEYLEN